MEIRFDAAKWANRSNAATGDYKRGVEAPRRSWSAAAKASEGNFEASMNTALSRKSYGKGIDNSSDAEWKKGASEKGASRFGPGVLGAQSDNQKGFAPYADVLRSLTLTPRGPKGTNYGRVTETGQALEARKNQ